MTVSGSAERERHNKTGVRPLSEKEKAMLDQWARLPEALQDRFLDRLQGAADALDAVGPLLAAAQDQRPEA